MKLKPNATLIGAFVLGGLALGAAVLLIFGGGNPFAARRRLMVYFDESVAGLDPGAAVKLRGVRRGRVLSLTPTLSPDARTTVVAVLCELEGGELSSPDGKPVDLLEPSTLKTLVDEGLRARLKPAGLSGEYAVDLDMYDPRRYPAQAAPEWAAGTPDPVVPAIPSATGELLDDLQAVARQVRNADLDGLSRGLGGLSRRLGRADVDQALRRVGDAADSVKDLADYLERNPNAILSGKKPPAKP